jgi:hypothetical protein
MFIKKPFFMESRGAWGSASLVVALLLTAAPVRAATIVRESSLAEGTPLQAASRQFTTIADTYVDAGAPTTNFGASATLLADGSPRRLTLLRFSVTGVGGQAVALAILHLQVDNVPGSASGNGGRLHQITPGGWQETDVTYDTRPAVDGPVLAMLGRATLNQGVDVDVTQAIAGDGVYEFAIDSTSNDGVHYRSREAAIGAPQLTLILGEPRQFTTVADTYVDANAPTTNFGASATLLADGSPQRLALLRFDITGLGDQPVELAILRLQVDNVPGSASGNGGRVHQITPGGWQETDVTYDTRPAVDGPVLATLGRAIPNQGIDVDVTGTVAGDGVYDFAIDSTSNDGVHYRSREAATGAPQLTLVLGAAPSTTTTSTSSTTTSTAPSSTTTSTTTTITTTTIGPTTTTTIGPTTTTTAVATTSTSSSSTAAPTTTTTATSTTVTSTTSTVATTSTTSTTLGSTDHLKTVFIIMMENHDWSSIKGNANAPYVNQTLLPTFAHAENYRAGGVHPSLPSYITLEAGDNLGLNGKSPLPTTFRIDSADHLTTYLNNQGVSWKAYSEALPGDGSVCPLTESGFYSLDHNPFAYFNDVTGNPPQSSNTYCMQHIRPYSELATDLENDTVARYNFIVPDDLDQGEKRTSSGSSLVRQEDTWLAAEVPHILSSAAYADGGVLFILWDEGPSGTDNPIGCIVVSAAAKPGYSNSLAYSHASMLRTVQEILGSTPLLRKAATATDLSDLFTSFP